MLQGTFAPQTKLRGAAGRALPFASEWCYDAVAQSVQLVAACVATAPGHCEDVIINAKPPWMDLQSCDAVGKRMIEKLGGSYECTPYRIPADAM